MTCIGVRGSERVSRSRLTGGERVWRWAVQIFGGSLLHVHHCYLQQHLMRSTKVHDRGVVGGDWLW